MKLANRVKIIKPSPTIAISGKARDLKEQGIDIISLSIGEPDFNTPEHVKAAGEQAIRDNFTHYPSVDGIAPLKTAIIQKFKQENQLDYGPKQILVSTGAKQSIYNLTQALLDAGDEAIIPTPYWVSYPSQVLLADGKPVIVETTRENHYKLTASELENAITDKTKMLFLNSPSNPSGMVYTKKELRALGDVLKKHPNIVVLSDDIYEHILWDEQGFHNILNICPDLYDQTIVVNGVSKAYAMTGWRIGYAAGPEKLIQAMKKVQSQSTSGACSIAQVAAASALSESVSQDCIQTMCKAFKGRHDHLLSKLKAITGIDCLAAGGAFYLFPNIKELRERLRLADDVAFCDFLLDNARVALVPGSAFGMPDHVRISYAAGIETLDEAVRRIEEAI